MGFLLSYLYISDGIDSFNRILFFFFSIPLYYLQLMDFQKTILLHFNQHQLQRIHHPGESSNLTNPEKGINCIQPLQYIVNKSWVVQHIYISTLYITFFF